MAVIYVIRNRKTGSVYVGKTAGKLEVRIGSHIRRLKAGRHLCQAMQADWNSLGSETFEYLLHKRVPAKAAGDEEYRTIQAFRRAGVRVYNSNLVKERSKPGSIARRRKRKKRPWWHFWKMLAPKMMIW